MAYQSDSQVFGGGPTRPASQGYQGQTAQPNATSYAQGPAGSAGAPPSVAGPKVFQRGQTQGGVQPSAPQGSPVTATGQIPPAQPAAPAPPPAPVRTNFRWGTAGQGVEGVDWGSTNNWDEAMWQKYEREHGITPQAGQPAAPGAPAAPAGPRAPGIDPTTLLNQAAPTYQAATFTQFGQHFDPTNPAIRAGADSLMQGILANPLSMSAENVAMLQAKQREDALMQQQALMQALGQRQAASGFETPGGFQAAQERRIGQGTQASLLEGQRQIALAKMQQDQADKLAALQAATGYMDSGAQRAIGLYGAQLQGEGAQAGEDFRGYASQSDAFNAHNDTALRAQQLALQQILGEKGIGLDQQRISNQASQYNSSYGLQQMALLNDILMGRLGYGAQLSGLQQQAQNNMISTILGGLR